MLRGSRPVPGKRHIPVCGNDHNGHAGVTVAKGWNVQRRQGFQSPKLCLEARMLGAGFTLNSRTCTLARGLCKMRKPPLTLLVAALVAVLAGSILPSSADQEVNVEAEGLKKQIEKLEGNIGSLNEQLEAARKESKTLKAESKTSAGLESSIKKEQARAQAAEKKLQELEASMKQSQNAESEVAALRKELTEAQAAAQASQEAIKASDSEKLEAQTEMERLSGELSKLTAANQQFEKAHKDVEAAQRALEKRASGSESALKQAQTKLKSAEDAAAAGQKLLESAETRAAEAAARLEELLHRTTKAWLPLWLEEHYNKGYKAIRPHAETAWKHASTAHQVAYAKGADWYETGSKKGQELWRDAGPMLHKTHTSLRTKLSELWKNFVKHAGPQIRSIVTYVQTTTKSLLSHPQARKLKKQAAQQVTNVKAQLKVYLKKHPLAAKYAKEPYLTWVLYGITAITVTSTWALGAAVLGLLGGKKAKRKLPKKLASASSSSRGTSGAVGVKSAKGKAKGRRITMGEDSIRIPE